MIGLKLEIGKRHIVSIQRAFNAMPLCDFTTMRILGVLGVSIGFQSIGFCNAPLPADDRNGQQQSGQQCGQGRMPPGRLSQALGRSGLALVARAVALLSDATTRQALSARLPTLVAQSSLTDPARFMPVFESALLDAYRTAVA